MDCTRAPFLLLISLFLVLAAGAGAQTLFLPGTAEVDELVALYRSAGHVFPTASFPLSKAELANLADRLGDGTGAVQQYLENTLRLDPAHDHVTVAGAAAFEYTYRTQDNAIDPGLPTELQAVDFQRLFLDQEPLAVAQLDYSRDSGIEIGITAHVEREYFLAHFSQTNLPQSGVDGNPVPLENQDIMRGFLWYDFHPLQVELGRDKIHVGSSRHSLLPSLNLPFLDMLRFRLPLGRLAGDLVVSTLENRRNGYDVASPDLPFGSTVILTAMHRWEYGFDTVRVGLGALVVYAREGNAYNLGDVFPVFSWHNGDIGSNHISIVADASWVPIPGLSLDAQVGLQAVNLSGIGVNNQAVPTCPAAIVSAETILPLVNGFRVDLYLEGGYTHYLWGNYALDVTTGTDALARAIDRYRMDGGNVIVPLTSPYGPGAAWIELTASLQGLRWLDASVTTRYLARMTDPATSAPVNLVQTPYAGSPEIQENPLINTWSLGLKASTLAFGFVKLSIEPTLFVQANNLAGAVNPWFELSISAGVVGKGVAATANAPAPAPAQAKEQDE